MLSLDDQRRAFSVKGKEKDGALSPQRLKTRIKSFVYHWDMDRSKDGALPPRRLKTCIQKYCNTVKNHNY
jgi:hypothetical protein